MGQLDEDSANTMCVCVCIYLTPCILQVQEHDHKQRRGIFLYSGINLQTSYKAEQSNVLAGNYKLIKRVRWVRSGLTSWRLMMERDDKRSLCKSAHSLNPPICLQVCQYCLMMIKIWNQSRTSNLPVLNDYLRHQPPPDISEKKRWAQMTHSNGKFIYFPQ